jgi:hypothetical protein
MYFLVVRFRPAARLNDLAQTRWERQVALSFHAAQSYNRSIVGEKSPFHSSKGGSVKRPVFAGSLGKAAAPDFSVAVFVVIEL